MSRMRICPQSIDRLKANVHHLSPINIPLQIRDFICTDILLYVTVPGLRAPVSAVIPFVSPSFQIILDAVAGLLRPNSNDLLLRLLQRESEG